MVRQNNMQLFVTICCFRAPLHCQSISCKSYIPIFIDKSSVESFMYKKTKNGVQNA